MLSIIIPIFNEKNNLVPLFKRLNKVLQWMKVKNEIIFINDGSTDGSLDVMLRLKNKYKNMKIISFGSNQGQTFAMQRGFETAKGDIIISIDGDLQNFPEDIPRLVKKLNRGYDVVCGWRHQRKDSFFSKKLPSYVSNFIIRTITGVWIHDEGCTLRAYTKEAVKKLSLYGDLHRFIPFILSGKGFKITEIKVRHQRRKNGKTKYGMGRILKGTLNLVMIIFLHKFSKRLSHAFGMLGLESIIAGIILLILDLTYILIILKKHLLSINIGPILFISFLLIFFGFSFLIFGVINEIMFNNNKQDIKEKIY